MKDRAVTEDVICAIMHFLLFFFNKFKKLSPNLRPFTSTYVCLIRLPQSWWFWRIVSALLHLAIHRNKIWRYIETKEFHCYIMLVITLSLVIEPAGKYRIIFHIFWFKQWTNKLLLYSFFWVIRRLPNFMCWRFGTLSSIFIGGISGRNKRDDIVGVFIREKVWLENSLSWLTFRHRASCILGQAFHCSPENAFYIFNQQIYFIIWYLLDRASLI